MGLAIPPGDERHEVKASATVPRDLTAYSIIPHMHLLGREIKVTATLPDGAVKPLVWIKDWDFNWQGNYRYDKPIVLPKDTRVDLEYTYDNSDSNPRNPNSPIVPVGWGERTSDEMCLAFLGVTLDYEKLQPGMKALKALMQRTDRVRINGPGTNLRFSIKGITAIICGGDRNIPDGEVFTAPVKNSVEGHITFNAPTIYQSIAFDGIRLDFKKGKIAKATSNQTEKLNKILDSDAGARYVGEFSLGFNPYVLEPMRDILFDEKIAGSFHFTPGQAYEEADNGNRSQVHWDMVNIQRKSYGGGEIYFDGKLIRRDGEFMPKELRSLNRSSFVKGK